MCVLQVLVQTGTTQTLTAAQSGVSQSQLSAYLHNKTQSQPTLHTRLRNWLRGRVTWKLGPPSAAPSPSSTPRSPALTPRRKLSARLHKGGSGEQVENGGEARSPKAGGSSEGAGGEGAISPRTSSRLANAKGKGRGKVGQC